MEKYGEKAGPEKPLLLCTLSFEN